jgi:hypothetical protein
LPILFDQEREGQGTMKHCRSPPSIPLRASPSALVALLLSLLMVMDMVFGLLPDRADFAREIRQQISEGLAIQSAALLQVGDIPTLQQHARVMC